MTTLDFYFKKAPKPSEVLKKSFATLTVAEETHVSKIFSSLRTKGLRHQGAQNIESGKEMKEQKWENTPTNRVYQQP